MQEQKYLAVASYYLALVS